MSRFGHGTVIIDNTSGSHAEGASMAEHPQEVARHQVATQILPKCLAAVKAVQAQLQIKV